MTDQNSPAFPTPVGNSIWNQEKSRSEFFPDGQCHGLTKREWMLTMVVQGIIASGRVCSIAHLVQDGINIVRTMEDALKCQNP